MICRLKLISAGRVLKNDTSLANQGVKNAQQILAIVLAESPDEAQHQENKIKELETVKTDSKLLASDDTYLTVWVLFF